MRHIILRIFWALKKIRFLQTQTNVFKISKWKCLKAYRWGFTPKEYVVYDLDNNSPKQYLSEAERVIFREQIKEKRILADNKIVCYNLLRHFVAMNTMFAYKMRGDKQYTMLERADDQNDLVGVLITQKALAYKRISLGGGGGFKLLEYKENGFFINREPCEKSTIEALFNDTDDYLIEEFCQQSSFEASLFPYCVNTIRLITVIHKDGTVEPTVAIQRMGVDEGKCVDNASVGGIYAQIDVDTGVMSAARSHALKYINDVYDRHPVTNTPIAGVTIPDWKSIVEQVVELHHRIRFTGLNFIAWDIALTDDGIRMIEANPSCGMYFLQASSGQRNGKVGAWMKEWGYIK